MPTPTDSITVTVQCTSSPRVNSLNAYLENHTNGETAVRFEQFFQFTSAIYDALDNSRFAAIKPVIYEQLSGNPFRLFQAISNMDAELKSLLPAALQSAILNTMSPTMIDTLGEQFAQAVAGILRNNESATAIQPQAPETEQALASIAATLDSNPMFSHFQQINALKTVMHAALNKPEFSLLARSFADVEPVEPLFSAIAEQLESRVYQTMEAFFPPRFHLDLDHTPAENFQQFGLSLYKAAELEGHPSEIANAGVERTLQFDLEDGVTTNGTVIDLPTPGFRVFEARLDVDAIIQATNATNADPVALSPHEQVELPLQASSSSYAELVRLLPEENQAMLI